MTINEYLKKTNTTKYRLAKMCGLPYATLSDICNGKTDIAKCSGETLVKISNAIGVPVDELLCGCDSGVSGRLNELSRKIRPVAKKYNLRSVYVFGSYARGEENENSDVDILIDREGSDIHGLFGMSALYNEMKESVGKEIDLVTLQSLKQASTMKNSSDFIVNIIRDRVRIYG